MHDEQTISESEDEERDYYFKLRTFFDNDCTKLLRNLLENYFPEYTIFLQKIPQDAYETDDNPGGIISKKHRHTLEKERSISTKFKFNLLCIIFQTGICDEMCGCPSGGWQNNNPYLADPQNTGDDILQLFKIWQQYLSDEDTEDLSEKDYDKICSILLRVSQRLSKNYPIIGKKFLRSAEKTLSHGIIFDMLNQILFYSSILYITCNSFSIIFLQHFLSSKMQL